MSEPEEGQEPRRRWPLLRRAYISFALALLACVVLAIIWTATR